MVPWPCGLYGHKVYNHFRDYVSFHLDHLSEFRLGKTLQIERQDKPNPIDFPIDPVPVITLEYAG